MKKWVLMLCVAAVITAIPLFLTPQGAHAGSKNSMDDVLNPGNPAGDDERSEPSAGGKKTGIVRGGDGAANLRAKPEGKIIGEVPNGTTVSITGKKDGWYQVVAGGKRGFIREDHIVKGKDEKEDKDGGNDNEKDGKDGDKDKNKDGEDKDKKDGKDGGRVETTPPFKAGMKGYAAFRAPSLAVTGKGTVLAFCEGRVDGHEDEGNMDVVLRRSTDRGRSWEDMQVIENDGKNPCKVACPVVLPSGRVLLVWCWNEYIKSESDRTTRRVLVTYSDDDGRSWAKSREITSSVYRDDWRWYGTGPCHAIVKAREPHKGRVVVAARHNSKTEHMYSHVIYSDDGGDTWHLGGNALEDRTSESTVVELSDGQIMLNSRNQSGKSGCRAVSLSRDGGNTFYRTYVDGALIEPRGCQASLLNHSFNKATGKCNILFSNPNHAEDRTNGTLRLSVDDGATWTKSVRYSDAPPTFSGYSDIALIGDSGDIAVLFEKGGIPKDKKDRYDMIDFKIVKFSDLK